MDDPEERVRRVAAEAVEIVDYDPAWPGRYERERRHLLASFPPGLIVRIEHVGSSSVPGLASKPIIDVLVGVRDLTAVREHVAPLLVSQGYEYFWRPTHGDDVPPWYAWFIRRDGAGSRTHHVHVVETGPEFAEHWGWVLFRDYLRTHPDTAARYASLKRRLARAHRHDRARYTEGKTAFVTAVTERARHAAPAGAPDNRQSGA